MPRKHRCPHRPYGIIGKGDQDCAVTEYRSEFIPREGGVRQSLKPEYNLQLSTARLDDETTHKYVFDCFAQELHISWCVI